MFKLVAVQEQGGKKAFAILDDTDGSFDIVSEEFIKRVSIMGLPIGGVSVTDSDGNFTYTDEFFIPMAEDSDEDEDFTDWEEDDEDTDEDWDDEEEPVEEVVEEDDDYDDDDWDDGEWDDEYFVEDSEVDKLYALLSEQQGNLLKRYYLWTSQILFSNSNVSGVKRLSAKNTERAQEKIADISALRGQGKTWIYAGYLDLGYRGADTCNLCGAPLRYQHYICDASVADIDQMFWGNDYSSIDMTVINGHIRNGHIFPFGIECTGDFFDIDKEDLDKIKKNQRDSTDEMKFMYRLMQMPESYANARASFRVFEEVMDAVSVSVARSKLFGQTSKFETPLISFYNQFKEAGMLYPRSLVSRLWHAFAGFEYPLRTTKRNVMYETADLQALAKEYTYKCVRTLDVEDRQRVYEVIDKLDAWMYSPKNYMQNLFMYQFMGIYSFNPQVQKDIEGVIDSPRCRDFGGSNKDSRELFEIYTGAFRNEEYKIKPHYKGYPYTLNKPKVSRLRYGTGCEFSAEYMVKLCLFCWYVHELSNNNVTSLRSIIRLKKIVSDVDKGGQYKKRSETEYMDTSDSASFVKDAEKAVTAGSYISRDILKTRGADICINSEGVSDRYVVTVSTIDEAIDLLKEDCKTARDLRKTVESKANELVDNLVAESNRKADLVKAAEEEARRVEEEERRAREELARKIQEDSSNQAQGTDEGIVSVSMNLSEVNFGNLPKSTITEFTDAVAAYQKGSTEHISAKRLVDVMTVAEINPLLKSQIDVQGSIYFDILQTVRRNKGSVTTRQRYRLEQAYDFVMDCFKVTEDAVVKEEIVDANSSSEEVNLPVEDSQEEFTSDTVSSDADGGVTTETQGYEESYSEPVETETPKPAENYESNISEPAKTIEEPEKPVVVDIMLDKELREKFNVVVSNLEKIRGMVDQRTFTGYGFALRTIKTTLKVYPKQRVVLDEMYSLIMGN